MITTNNIRKQTGWRINPVIIGRVKEAAKRKKISTNDFVEEILEEATKGIETEEERIRRLETNDRFLERFAGRWKGNETPEQILTSIKSEENFKEPVTI